MDVDVTHADPTGWEALHAHVVASGVKRICNAPLAAPRRVLGILSLGRLTPTPFTSEELDWAAQIAVQLALALENALAFDEIASLKDRLARENIYLAEEIRGAQHFGEIIFESKALKRILSQVGTVAATDTTVLLLGETGTGKGLIARAIHAAGERRSRTLVTVNCATSPAGLLESEWFGHERGAFTGAGGAAARLGLKRTSLVSTMRRLASSGQSLPRTRIGAFASAEASPSRLQSAG